MSASSAIMLLCATPGKSDLAVLKIRETFPGSRASRGPVVPGVCLATAAPLRSVEKRYDGAAPYGGPGPAQLWRIEVPVLDRVSDPQRLRETVMRLHEDGLLIDHDVWVPSVPDPEVAPPSNEH